MWMDFGIVPKLREYTVSFARFSFLFAYGGWVMITSIIGPILVYLDRFLIGSLLTIAAVAYYSVPYDMVTRLWIISVSLTMTLFPAFSAMEGVRDRQRLSMFFARSIKYVFLISGTIVVLIVVYAEEILQIWLGGDFVIESTVAMQVLALGVLINSLAQTPFALLQGVGRPDLPAKFHLIELPVYVGIAWILVSQFGIAGAAGAWTIRVVLDTALLFMATFKSFAFRPVYLQDDGGTQTRNYWASDVAVWGLWAKRGCLCSSIVILSAAFIGLFGFKPGLPGISPRRPNWIATTICKMANLKKNCGCEHQ